ncbi:hypothetical protein ACTNEO_15605 [Gracilibacillus sp. HCP3S3_G5_1]
MKKLAAGVVDKLFIYYIITTKVIDIQLAFNKGPAGYAGFSYWE